MSGMLSVLAELQRELTVANTRDRLATTRARGRTGGRQPKLSPHQVELVQQPYDARTTIAGEIAAMIGVPCSTIPDHLHPGTGDTPAEPSSEPEPPEDDVSAEDSFPTSTSF